MKAKDYIKQAEIQLKEQFLRVEEVAVYNQEKVLNAFKKCGVSQRHFIGTNGYGYGDDGRDTLNLLFSTVFNTENAIVSPLIASGTHAIWLCLSGLLRPGDAALSITGKPYDTLHECLYGENNGSLKDYNINFEYMPLNNGRIDVEKAIYKIKELKPKMIYIQRSRGYEWRNALSVGEIGKSIKAIKDATDFNGVILTDNCYGEFVEKSEPTEVGADVIVGSLIKNTGGGIAPTGGYICGTKNCIEKINQRLTAPSIAGEIGSYIYGYKDFYQGLFLAPSVVKNAVKSSLLLGSVMEKMGYQTSPNLTENPADIIRAIKFNTAEELIKFIQTIQKYSPIDSYVVPEPWEMPGYEDKIIMAAGCFVSGASIELSADAPIKKPYIAYVQGSLTYEHMVVLLNNLDI